MKRAVIFDLDGTLADTLTDIADIMNRILAGHGFPTHEDNAYKYFVGEGIRNLVTKSLPENARNEQNIERCFAQMMTDYEATPIHKACLYNGIPELLDALSSQKLKLSVLSNKADTITQAMCTVLLKQWKFEIIMGANKQFPHKPDPAAALFIADTMQVLPNQILYLGDTNVDMLTATRAGFFPVGVTWGFRPVRELVEGGAKHIINHPMELLSVF